MSTLKRLVGGSLFVFFLAGTALPQQQRSAIETPRDPVAAAAAPLVTVTASAQRVRFVSPGTVVQLRLEVYNEAGQKLFDTELRGGNVMDWHLQDGAGQRLQSGSYACVLTIKSLSGRLSQRMGIVTVNEEKAAVEAAGTAQLSMAQQQTIGPVEGTVAFTIVQESEAAAITAVTHDGTQGQVTSTKGALTFRTGDVFAGADKEHMRITPEGNVGIGTDKPAATLDVAGTIRAERVLIVKPWQVGAANKTSAADTLQADAGGTVEPMASGSGTQNKIAKWTDNAGALGDSVITETAGNIGIGTTTPGALLDVTNNTNHLKYTPTTGKLTLTGPASSLTVNPGLRLEFNSDPDPALSYLAYSHDNVSQAYDAHWNGAAWVSSHLGANFAIYKNASQLAIGFNAGTPKGSTFPAFNTTTGVIFSKTGSMGIGGAPATAKLYVNGNVGIGTTGPTFKLHLVDPSNTGLRVQTNALGGTVASFGGRGDFQIDAPGVFGGRFIVNEAGSVGIGTPTPLAKLDIQAGADSDGQFDPKAMAFQYRTGGFRHWIRTRHNAIPGSGNAIDFFVNDSATAGGSTGPGLGSGSAHVMTLDGGRVGIGGITTPSETLSVGGKIESTFGGFKFPDATVQTTAAANATYTTVNDTDLAVTTNFPDETVILQLNLPAGTYLVTANSVFFNGANYFNANNSRLIMCRFTGETVAEGVFEGYRHAVTIQGLTRVEMSFHSIVTIPAGVTAVGCRAFSWYGDLTAESRRLTAVKLSGDVVVQ